MDEKAAGQASKAGNQVLVSGEWLVTNLHRSDLRVVDARFELMEPSAGRRTYAEGHVPGAVHLDLDADLAAPPGEGGRHPLPDLNRLAMHLGRLGIGNEHEVVVYDQSGSMYAARAWWLLRYLGHDAVRVLDGGLSAYVAAGGELTDEAPRHPGATFTPRVRSDMAIGLDELRGRLQDPDLVLLDARAPERYRGEVEPLDAKAGHVPGARNVPYTSVSRGGGLLPPDELRRVLAVDDIPQGAEVVAYCGSGVSAAQLVLALEAAGKRGARLYPGSWSEWSRRDDLPVATGEEAQGA